ncbi:hypothetical protein SAY87_021636 [Trapa incisa]|uniref:F-box/kelch-repeat protein n=1 Tax=Trapa incisa TaxID=236973 RepID=A0AAN7PSC0_9MYRT|nr:hypothetical protein SAY87_021636 [Trapa incisa]
MSKEKGLEREEGGATMPIKKRGGVVDSTDPNMGGESQDADYCSEDAPPSLSDELEVLILARVPRSEYSKFSAVNKRFLSLVSSGELYKVRRDIGVREPSVFVLASGESNWWAFDRSFRSCRQLPILPSDVCFASGDKETLSAGTHLLVSGMEIDGRVTWRYELTSNRWFKGPPMNSPRGLFASATCGNHAVVAGGIRVDGNREVLRTAERYDPDGKSWVLLPSMNRRRQFCSGCYMDGKFYVIGGKSEDGQALTCAEAYDETNDKWELIPDMLKDTPISTYHSPPLVAVVNNHLYALETSLNVVRVYVKATNSWRTLGPVPIRADFNRGWGVAFKSLGDELLVIGSSSASYTGHGMSIFTCIPDPTTATTEEGRLRWEPLECSKNRSSHFIRNCCVMIA